MRVALWRLGKDAQRIGEWPGFRSAALSLDGKHLAMVQDNDQTVHLFDIVGDKVQPRGTLPVGMAKTRKYDGFRYPLRFTHDGRLGVSAEDEKSIAFWDIAGPTPQKLGAVQLPDQGTFRFAAQAPRMVVFNEGLVSVWRLTEKGAEREISTGLLGYYHSNIADVVISADGNRLVSGHINGAVAFWEIKDGKLVQRNSLTPQPLESSNPNSGATCHFSPKGEYLTTYGEAGTTIWHLGSKAPKGFLPAQLRNEWRPTAFFGSDIFATSGSWSATKAWRATPTGITLICEDPDQFYSVYASPQAGAVLTLRGIGNSVYGSFLDMNGPSVKVGEKFAMGDQQKFGVTGMSANGRIVARAFEKGKTFAIRIVEIDGAKAKWYDLDTKLTTKPFRIRLSPDGKWLAAWGHGGSGLWRLDSDKAKWQRTLPIPPCGFSPDSKRLALSPHGGSSLEIRDIESWESVWKTQIPVGINDAVFAPDGRHLLVANANQTAYILRLAPPEIKPMPAWQSLTPGKELAGWKQHPKDRALWKLGDGVVSHAAKGTFPPAVLFSADDSFANFHLKLEFKVTDIGQAGLMFRTKFFEPNEHSLPEERTPRNGYLIELGPEGAFKRTSGRIVDLGRVRNGTENVYVADTWGKLELIADGNHFIVRINDVLTMDVRDDKNLYQKGHLVLEVHGKQALLQVRNIEVKRLP